MAFSHEFSEGMGLAQVCLVWVRYDGLEDTHEESWGCIHRSRTRRVELHVYLVTMHTSPFPFTFFISICCS